ncbi:MAG: WYL domain-containing protein [bacterium]|nr:WYL domain-containing protein [bacterium]
MSRLSARDRLGRMLELVPWVMSQGAAEIGEISQRFDYPQDELREDLTKVLFVVGLYPFTPDQLINVIGLDTEECLTDADEDQVAITNADYFSRPLRLTSAQALSLIGAAKALLMESDTDGPLSRGLKKLAAGLDISPNEDLEINLGDAPPEWLQPLRLAIQQHKKTQITYYSFGRGQITERIIQPQQIFSERGNLYVSAYCETAEGIRVFLIDRIRAVQVLDERFAPLTQTNPPSAFQPRLEDPRAVIHLAPQASWVLEKYPIEQRETLPNNKIAITMRISETSRLERLLLQLGAQAELHSVEPPLQIQIAQSAATRVLSRYL